MMKPVELPSNIINRFTNKTMAIVGYEVDQVFKTKNGDVPLPITCTIIIITVLYLRNSETSMNRINYTNKIENKDRVNIIMEHINYGLFHQMKIIISN